MGAGLEDIKVTVLPPRVPENRSVGASLYQIDRFGILERMFVRKIGSPESVTDDVRDRFNATLGALGTPLSFATVLLLALPLYLCFRRRRPLLLEHAVFTMHFFSFVLLTAPLLLLGFKLGRASSFLAFVLVMLLVTLWQFAYLAVGIRRFYLPDRTRLTAWPTAVVLTAALYLLNSVLLTAVQFFAAAVAIWRL